jgi:hypothetical protein
MQAENVMLEHLVEGFDKIIAGASAAGLDETVALMKIARLDLVLRVYNISETEFQTFIGVIESNLRRHSHRTELQDRAISAFAPRFERSRWRGRRHVRSRA